jgi:trk system potassium uptake protein TrkH
MIYWLFWAEKSASKHFALMNLRRILAFLRIPSFRAPMTHEHTHRRIPIALRIVFGLAVSIIVGTLVLLLPIMTTGPRLTFMQALFTATSALTVTGLSVISAGTDLTLVGQATLLIMIQFGGVGYMFAAALTLRLLGRRLSLLNRLALSSSLGLNTPQEIAKILKRVLIGIILIEGSGVLLLFLHWSINGIVPADKVLFFAIFHAVSAFCNAGFDLFTAVSPHGIPNDTITLSILSGLIIMGGLGIPVLSELLTRNRRRMSLHTRLTLSLVVALILSGWIAILLPEMNGGTLEGLPLDRQISYALFQSISTRTAGFAGLPAFETMWPETSLVMIMLMFIGSAPASMGGGITTGTFAVLMLGLWGYARGLPTAQVGDRAISRETVRRAGAILTISIALVMIATWIVLTAHDVTLNQALFEVVSAFATCGLSLGITGSLNTIGQLVIIVMMFWGRLGALTIVIAIAQRGAGHEQVLTYPEEPVLIG